MAVALRVWVRASPHSLGGWLRALGRFLAFPRLYAIRATGHRDSLLSHVRFPSRHSRPIARELVSRRSCAGAAGGRQARAVIAGRIPSLPALVGGGETTHRAKAVGTGNGIDSRSVSRLPSLCTGDPGLPR